VHYNGAKPQNCIVEKFCTTGNKSLLSLPGIVEKNCSFNFKHYNLTICAVNFRETFCTCFPSSLGQDPIVEVQKSEKNSFGLLELEMVNLECFFEKNGLGPLGVKQLGDCIMLKIYNGKNKSTCSILQPSNLQTKLHCRKVVGESEVSVAILVFLHNKFYYI
jgi:hypothetical protein